MPLSHFTVGAKGGTGKSTAVRFLITYVRDHGADPLLLDLDDENRTLSRFFPAALQVEIKKKCSTTSSSSSPRWRLSYSRRLEGWHWEGARLVARHAF